MTKALVLAGLLALVVVTGGDAWAGEDPHDLYGSQNFDSPALFGSAYRHDVEATFVDTWIWLSLISAPGNVHIQFYDPTCARGNDWEGELTENETTLLFTSEVAPDSPAGVFLVEAFCSEAPPGTAVEIVPCDLLGEIWYIDLDGGIIFARPLYTAGGGGAFGRWDIFQHEHWDWVADGFDFWATHLWLNCPTGSDGPGTSGNTALYDDLLQGAPGAQQAEPKKRSLPGFLPGASQAAFNLFRFDEEPNGSVHPDCSCLTDGRITDFSHLFRDFWGLVQVRFFDENDRPALGLAHKTVGVPGAEIFDKRFHRFQVVPVTGGEGEPR